MIPYGNHSLNDVDIETVVDVLKSGYLNLDFGESQKSSS